MGDFISTVRAKILNLLKPVIICSKSQKNNRKKFLAWFLQVFKRYFNRDNNRERARVCREYAAATVVHAWVLTDRSLSDVRDAVNLKATQRCAWCGTWHVKHLATRDISRRHYWYVFAPSKIQCMHMYICIYTYAYIYSLKLRGYILKKADCACVCDRPHP